LSLKKKFVKGAIWNSISQFGSQGLNFIFTIFLARLLTPNDFGVLGQVTFFSVLLCFFSEFGLCATLIQKKNINEIDYHTAFWGIVFFSITLYISVYFAAPYIAAFYNNDDIITITRLVFIQFLVMPLSLINEVQEYKNLNFNKIALAELAALLASGSLSIALAYLGYGVWSLVPLNSLYFILRSLIIFFSTKWRPRFRFSFTLLRQLLKTGIHFTYRHLTVYMSENTDYFLIGKIAGASTLGIYTIAFRISTYPFSKVYGILGRMLFPAFNLISDDLTKIKENYQRLSNLGGLVLIPLLITIYFGIDPFILLFMGEKWVDSVLIVKILVVYLVFASISFADDSLMLTLYKIKYLNMLKTLVTLALLIFGFFAIKLYGGIGMAVTFALVSLICTILIKVALLKEIKLSAVEYFTNMKFVLIWCAAYGVIVAVYSKSIAWLTKSPVVFLSGEGVIFMLFMLLMLVKKGIINIKTKKIDLDAI
jgi:O-antigen/teichoic acid export membrane protein